MWKFRIEDSVDAFVVGVLASAASGGAGTIQFWIIILGWIFVSGIASVIDRARGLT